jgi:uncharacterized protein (DUF983 family)
VPFRGVASGRRLTGAVPNLTPNPFEALEPRRDDDPAPPLWPDVGGLRVLLRGLRKRCPRCGERRIFDSWFRLKRTCPRCDLLFEKEEGGFLGAITLNYGVATGAWVIMLGVWLAFTVPDVRIAPLMAASLFVLVVVPLWFYPRSKGLWAAIEYLVLRSQPDYRPPVRRDPRARGLE